MDVTPELLEGFEFRRKGRGYDPEQVDELLSRTGSTISDLRSRLRDASTRAEAAENRAKEYDARTRASSESDETIQRTLLLAQRTADAAVQEAEETASRKVTEANEEARRVVAEAEQARTRSLQSAEEEVRASVEETRSRLLEEIAALESIRDSLMSDVEVLEQHVEVERERLQASIDSLNDMLTQSERLGRVDLPELSDPAPIPEPVPPRVVESATTSDAPATEVEVVDDTPGPMRSPEAENAFASAWESETTADGDDWAAPADAPPPPPPPPDAVVDDGDVVDAPPPPPPPPDFGVVEPVPDPPATLDEAIGTAKGGFGGLESPTEDETQDGDDNAWLAELDDGDEAGAGNTGRRRFGRRG